MSANWPPGRVERLRREVEAGHAPAEIAAALGVSLPMVIHKAAHLGLDIGSGVGRRPAAEPLDAGRRAMLAEIARRAMVAAGRGERSGAACLLRDAARVIEPINAPVAAGLQHLADLVVAPESAPDGALLVAPWGGR